MPLAEKISNKNHIIWDWNGTILNDLDHTVDTVNQVLKNENMDPVTVDHYKTYFEFPVKNYYDRLGFDYSKKSFEAICDDFVEIWMKGFADCKPFPFIKGILESNLSAGKSQSILSATDQANLDRIIDHYELRPLFDHVYGIEDNLAASKVERGHQLLKHSGYNPKDTVLIGDTTHDLEVGEALGIEVILVTHGHQCGTRLKLKHHHVLDLDLL